MSSRCQIDVEQRGTRQTLTTADSVCSCDSKQITVQDGKYYRASRSEAHLQKRLNKSSRRESNRHMKIRSALSLLAAASLALSSAAFAAGAKTYEVTGPVLEVNDSMIVVQKGKDRWEINRDASTKVAGDVKVGDKVHITYTMTATDVEVKPGKGAKKEKKEAAKAAPTP
jgi:hypothetical protein